SSRILPEVLFSIAILLGLLDSTGAGPASFPNLMTASATQYAVMTTIYALIWLGLVGLFISDAVRRRGWERTVQEWGVGFALFRLLWSAAVLVLLASAVYATLSIRTPSAFTQ